MPREETNMSAYCCMSPGPIFTSLSPLSEAKPKKQIVVARKPRPGEELGGPVTDIGLPARTKVRSLFDANGT